MTDEAAAVIQRFREDAERFEQQSKTALAANDFDAAEEAGFAAMMSLRLADRLEKRLVELAEGDVAYPVPLPGADEPGTLLGTMHDVAQAKSSGAAISAGMVDPENRTLFFEKLAEAGLSLPGWVALQKSPSVKENTAKSWTKRPGHGGRKIPRSWADRIAKAFKCKELRRPESWPNGIDESK